MLDIARAFGAKDALSVSAVVRHALDLTEFRPGLSFGLSWPLSYGLRYLGVTAGMSTDNQGVDHEP